MNGFSKISLTDFPITCTTGYRFGFNGHEKDDEVKGSGNHISFGDYGYDPRIGRRWNIDPMTKKYPEESPYLVFGDNPILYIDHDGKEKILAVNLKDEKNKFVIEGAKKYTDDGAIHIFAHGSSQGIEVFINGKRQVLTNAKELNKYLLKHSTIWKNKGSKDKPVIVLHSCNTGRDQKDGTASFAEQVSSSKEFNGSKIIAPNERDYFNENGEVGTYKAKYANPDGTYLRNPEGEIKSQERSDTPGSWRIFENGKQIEQYKGYWKPKETPSTIEEIQTREK